MIRLKVNWQNKMHNSSAIFHSLYIVSQTSSQYAGISLSELNFLSYFSCLLSLYKGNAVSDWGYSFLKGEQGVPVSAELAESCNMLVETDELKVDGVCYGITPTGKSRLQFFQTMDFMRPRAECLQAACDCLLMDSIVGIISLISRDSVIKESCLHPLKRLNSDENSSLQILYKQFEVVKNAIGFRRNLFVPATSWLLYLRQKQGKA